MVTVYQKVVTRTESYQYDGMGNRTTERILLRKEYGYTYEYYPNSNRLKSKVKQDGTERIDYEYDDNGNLTVKIVTRGDKVDRWDYKYDLFNQLEQVKKNGEVVSSFIYDPNGFRVEKVGSKGKVHYVPLLNGEVGYRKEINKGKEYSFIYVGGQHLARVNGIVGGAGKKFYYQNDHLGSALAITDENGNKVVERDFTPFGEKINLEETDGEDPDEDGSAFTGKDWDEDVGLYYYNARWYDPEVGRFTTEDSMADDPNLYSYCGNSPMNFTDPTGHFKIGFVNISIRQGLLGVAADSIPEIGLVLQGASAIDLMIDYNSGDILNETENNTEAAKTDAPVQDPVENNGNNVESGLSDTIQGEEGIEKIPAFEDILKMVESGDMTGNIDEITAKYGLTNDQVLEVLKIKVNAIVNNLTPAKGPGFVELPFNTEVNEYGFRHFEVFGLEYGQYGITKDDMYWGQPNLLKKQW